MIRFAAAMAFAAAVAVATGNQPPPAVTTAFPQSIAAPSLVFAGPRGGAIASPPPGGSVVNPGGRVQVRESAAANAIAQAGGANGPWLLGVANGGVFRTTADPATERNPHWVQVSDANMTCASITAIHVSAFENTRVYAACGAATSSQQGFATGVRFDSGWTGFAISEDSGATWRMVNTTWFYGHSVEAILELPDGALLVAVGTAYHSTAANSGGRGIWRVDSWRDANFTRVYNASYVYAMTLDLIGPPASPGTATVFATTGAVGVDHAIVSSTDGGRTFAPNVAGIEWFPGPDPQATYATLAYHGAGRHLFALFYLCPAAMLSLGLSGGVGLVYYANLTAATGAGFVLQWQRLGAQPVIASPYAPANQTMAPYGGDYPNAFYSLEGDYSAKDRGAIAVDPDTPDLLYVTGNGNWGEYRVRWQDAIRQPNATCTYNQTDGATYPCLDRSVDASIWQPMTNDQGMGYANDTLDTDAAPHVDTRALAFSTNATGGHETLLMTSDGGVFVRMKPSLGNAPGTRWYDWTGDLPTFEIVHASMHAASTTIIGGAQDNEAWVWDGAHEIAQRNAATKTVTEAVGADKWGGDGQWTAVDSTTNPTRPVFYACIQNLMQLAGITLDIPGTTTPAMTFASNSAASSYLGLSTPGRFPVRAGTGPAMQLMTDAFPWMQMPFVLSRVDERLLYFFANASSNATTGGAGPGLFFVNASDPNSPAVNALPEFPTLGRGEMILAQAVGGRIANGSTVEPVVVAATKGALFYQPRSGAATGLLRIPFPEPFSAPTYPASSATSAAGAYCRTSQAVGWNSCTETAMVWPNHANTMSIAIAPNDARVIAVTGWPAGSLVDNSGTERLYFTSDVTQPGGGLVDVMENMAAAANVGGSVWSYVRPQGLAFLIRNNTYVLLVGTARGLVAGNLPLSSAGYNPAAGGSGSRVQWVRLGRDTAEFPIVKVTSVVSYDAQDVVLVATMGRGAYLLQGAGAAIAAVPVFSQTPNATPPAPTGTSHVVPIVIGAVAGVVVLGAAIAGLVVYRRRHTYSEVDRPLSTVR